MDALEQLEASVDKLLARLALLKTENARLQHALATLSQENIKLTAENSMLQATVAQEESLRQEVRGRIELLLRKIRDHDSVS